MRRGSVGTPLAPPLQPHPYLLRGADEGERQGGLLRATVQCQPGRPQDLAELQDQDLWQQGTAG